VTNNFKNCNPEKFTFWLYAINDLGSFTTVAIRNSKNLVRLKVSIMVSISVVLLCVGFDPYEGGTNFYQHIDNSQLFNMA
jgi:hypothetical protein